MINTQIKHHLQVLLEIQGPVAATAKQLQSNCKQLQVAVVVS
jgi:hypothetical protein